METDISKTGRNPKLVKACHVEVNSCVSDPVHDLPETLCYRRRRRQIVVNTVGRFKLTGRKYPETVVLRLIDARGRPEVRMAASEQGEGLSFVGDNDATRILLEADSAKSSLKLTNMGGKRKLFKL